MPHDGTVQVRTRLVAGDEVRTIVRTWPFDHLPRPGESVAFDLWDDGTTVGRVEFDLGLPRITIHLGDVRVDNLGEVLNHAMHGWQVLPSSDPTADVSDYLARGDDS